MSTTPSVLFVCVKNGGTSQLAAGLLRAAAGDTGIDITHRVDELNEQPRNT